MKVAITGGKGGTGKSLVATALAVELAKRKYKVLLVDADVDCPNDHLILSIKRKKVKDVSQPIPKFDFKKCIKCGRCSEVCKQRAIVFVKGKNPIFIPELCYGCSACMIACPTKAISKDKKKIGTIYSGANYGVNFVSGEIEIGVEESSPVVNACKKYLKNIEKDFDFVIIDTAAGTHCTVISALLECDLALAVTEPTPLGEHDLKLILQLLKVLKVPSKIILNRSTIGDKKKTKEISKKAKVPILAEIPYKKEILSAYMQGKPVKDKSIEYIARSLINKNWK